MQQHLIGYLSDPGLLKNGLTGAVTQARRRTLLLRAASFQSRLVDGLTFYLFLGSPILLSFPRLLSLPLKSVP